MQFVQLIKASIFDAMIVNSALIFLGLIDFFWNGYDYVSKWISKMNEKKALSTAIPEPVKPSYSIQ